MLVVWASVYKLFSPVEDLTFCVWLVVYEECYFSFKLGRKAFCHLEMARLVCSGPGGIKYACISQNMKLLLGMLWKGLKEVSRLFAVVFRVYKPGNQRVQMFSSTLNPSIYRTATSTLETWPTSTLASHRKDALDRQVRPIWKANTHRGLFQCPRWLWGTTITSTDCSEHQRLSS